MQDYISSYNKGTELLTKKKYAKAVPELKKSIALFPTGDAYLNIGTCYKLLDKDSLASDSFRNAITCKTYLNDNIPALGHTNLGLMHYVYDRDTDALKHFNAADAMVPGIGDANWNKATCLLRMACSGDHSLFFEGWQQYEYRFKKTSPVTLKGTFGHLRDKPWNGERDVRLLVCAEQGVGDNIMFARYMPALEAEFGCTVTLQAVPDLGALLWHRVVGVEFNPLDYDYVLPLGSICRFVGFIDPTPYVSFDSHFDLEGFNIGIVWSGNADHANDRHRSVSPQRFKRFGRYGKLWSLNPSAKAVPFAAPCAINSWTDTAKWLNSMDLVITVDTSVAHLAGAMGVRTWMIQPFKETDFRWGNNNSKSNIWYSSLDVYRNPNNWEFVFDRLEEDLAEIA